MVVHCDDACVCVGWMWLYVCDKLEKARPRTCLSMSRGTMSLVKCVVCCVQFSLVEWNFVLFNKE
jgi:hypothetical protein